MGLGGPQWRHPNILSLEMLPRDTERTDNTDIKNPTVWGYHRKNNDRCFISAKFSAVFWSVLKRNVRIYGNAVLVYLNTWKRVEVLKILHESKLGRDYYWWGLPKALIPSLTTISKLFKGNTEKKNSGQEQHGHSTIFKGLDSAGSP